MYPQFRVLKPHIGMCYVSAKLNAVTTKENVFANMDLSENSWVPT
jgi:hypothetical protein